MKCLPRVCGCLCCLTSKIGLGEEDIRNYLRRWLRVSDLCSGIMKRYEENFKPSVE